MTDLVKIAREFTLVDDKRTHYLGCERDHISCLVNSMANELERSDEWRDGVLDKITTVGYILGQHDGEALVNTAKRVTDEIERMRAEISSAKPDPCKDGSCSCCWVDEPSEIERLRADKRKLIDQLRYIRTHLYAATVQRSPADDRIIADHIEQAYLRASEVIMEMDANEPH